MKLSMWIFAEGLKQFHPQTDISSNKFVIETVRLYSSSQERSYQVLYVGRHEDFFPQKIKNIVCMQGENVLILDTYDLDAVMNRILQILDLFSKWNSDMLEHLTTGAMPQDLFDASIHIFSRPMFLLDYNQRALAHSSNFKLGEVDEQWDEIITHGSSTIDYLLKINAQDSEHFSYKGVYFSPNKFFPNNLYENNFFFQNHWVGTAGIIEKDTPLRQDEIDCFSIFCSYLERWFQSHIQEQQSVLLSFQLQAAITDANADTKDLQRRLILDGWQETDALVFIKLDAPFQPYSINQHLCRTLTLGFPSVHAVTTELSICLLCNCSQLSLNTLTEQLIPLLESSRYYGTVSQYFTMKDSFYKNYKQLNLISKYCDQQVGEIYRGKNYMLPYFMYEMKQNLSAEVLHPELRMLKDYDAQHHTDFYHTLYAYLKNERSPLATAKELNLHRNTLAYRLKRLEELLNSDLNDPSNRFYLLLSFELEMMEQ